MLCFSVLSWWQTTKVVEDPHCTWVVLGADCFKARGVRQKKEDADMPSWVATAMVLDSNLATQ